MDLPTDGPDYEAITNPPEGGIDGVPADSIQQLQDHLNVFARAHGFAFIRKSGGTPRNGENTFYYLCCDRDQVRQTEGVGLRQATTSKTGCL